MAGAGIVADGEGKALVPRFQTAASLAFADPLAIEPEGFASPRLADKDKMGQPTRGAPDRSGPVLDDLRRAQAGDVALLRIAPAAPWARVKLSFSLASESVAILAGPKFTDEAASTRALKVSAFRYRDGAAFYAIPPARDSATRGALNRVGANF